MNSHFLIFFSVLCLLTAGTAPAREFKTAEPGFSFHFPEDHGSHENYRIEWWYFTGHLTDRNKHRTGFELTFFRSGIEDDSVRQNSSRWRVENIYSAHFAISNESTGQFWFREKLSRNALGKAGSESGRFRVWIDNWSAHEKNGVITLAAQEGEGGGRNAIRLNLTPEKPPVIHGEGGVSPKDYESKNRSHYYSFTRMRTEGTLMLDGTARPVTGLSWMDHEFGSNQLGEAQVGWDWFSLQLADSTELMIYRIRRRDGSVEPASGGTWIRPDGTAVPLARDDIAIDVLDHWQSRQSGSRYPARWRIRVPAVRLAVEVAPTVSAQELITRRSTQVTYWEGSVTCTGEREGRSVTGLGYAELTGYAKLNAPAPASGLQETVP